MSTPTPEDVRQAVRINYGHVTLKVNSTGCGCSTDSGCCGGNDTDVQDVSRILGYSGLEMGEIPAGAHMGLGCGYPTSSPQLRCRIL